MTLGSPARVIRSTQGRLSASYVQFVLNVKTIELEVNLPTACGQERYPNQRSRKMKLSEKKVSYKSDIVLGERYRDDQTGYEGTATAVYFFQHACERVCLETYDPTTKKVIESTFDSPRLTSTKTGETATTEKTGGPARETAVRPAGGAR